MKNSRGVTYLLSAFSILLAVNLLARSSIASEAQLSSSCELVIYTYDSIVARGGLGPEVFPQFEKQSGCKIKALTSGDGVQALSRMELDQKRGKALGQILLGIDQTLWPRAELFAEGWNRWRPKGHSSFKKEITSSAMKLNFLPYDFGVLALMGHISSKPHDGSWPHSLSELTQATWKKKFILEDPRTSTPGLELILFSDLVLREKFEDFWSSMKTQWLAMPPGWDAAYGLFVRGEAPLVWSYMTSQAYHEEHGSHDYQAILFDEGQPLQIETAMLVKNSFSSPGQKKVAQDFLNYLVSLEVQNKIPKTNWMFPIRKDADLPESFKRLPLAKKLWTPNGSKTDEILKRWNRAVLQ